MGGSGRWIRLPDRDTTVILVAVVFALGASAAVGSIAVQTVQIDGIEGGSIQTDTDLVRVESISLAGSETVDGLDVTLSHDSEHLVGCRISTRLRETSGATVSQTDGEARIYSERTATPQLRFDSGVAPTAFAVTEFETLGCEMLGWPMLGFDADHRSTPVSIIPTIEGPETLDRVWETGPAGGTATDSPTVADGTVYAGGNDTVEAFDRSGGRSRWTYPTGGTVSVGAVTNGTVYAGSEDGSVYAIHDNGTLEWSTATGTPVRTAPAVNDSRVYVGNGSSITALSTDGEVAWSVSTGGNVTARPVVANGTVYAGSEDGSVYAIDTNGTQRWSASTGGPVRAAPAVVDGVVYAGSDSSRVFALNATDGAVAWEASTGGVIRAAPAVVNGSIYAGSDDGSLYAFDHANGTQQWATDLGAAVRAGPAVANGTVYTGTEAGEVVALEEDTGGVLATGETDGPVRAGPTVTSGHLYVGADSVARFGFVPESWPSFQFGPGNTGYGETTPPDGPVGERWASGVGSDPPAPSVSNGTVYVGGEAVYALNETDGTERWNVSTGPVSATPAVEGETVYVPIDETVYALSAANGSERWQYAAGASIDAPVAVDGGRVFVGTADGVTALDSGDGTVEWSEASAPVTVAPAVYDETLFVASGRTVAARAVSDGSEAWTFDAGTNVSAAMTAAADGVIVGSEANEGPLVGETRLNSRAAFDRGRFNATGADAAVGNPDGRLSLGYRNGTSGDGLAGYYRFDRAVSGSGGTVVDYSGEDNDATARNGTDTGVPGVFDTNAYDFEGNWSYVEQSALPGDQAPMTVSMWYNMSELPPEGESDTLFGGFETNETSFRLFNGSDRSEYIFQTWSEEFGGQGVYPEGVTIGEWTHVTAVIEPIEGSEYVTYRLYVDGRELENSTGRFTPAANDPHVGAQNKDGDLDRSFDGDIDEVHLYETALSPAEVRELYRHGRDGTYEGSYSRTVRADRPKEPRRVTADVGAIPPEGTLNVTVEALDRDGRTIDSEEVALSAGSNSATLDLPPTHDARIRVAGTSPTPEHTWLLDSISLEREQAAPGATVVAAREDWARGTFDGSSADAATGDRSGALTLGYENGSSGDDLVGAWRLDGTPAGTNGTVPGYDGTNRSGTTSGGVTTGVEGAFGTSAFDFDGTDDAVDLGDPDALNRTGSITVQAWAHLSNDSTNRTVLGKGDQYALRATDDGRWEFLVDNGSAQAATASDTATTDTWVHLAGRYDAASETVTLFVDGSAVATADAANVTASNSPVAIGTDTSANGEFAGRIDEPRVYASALSDADIETLSRVSGSEYAGSYTQTTDTDRLHDWRTLRTNVTGLPSGATLEATVSALDSDGTTRDEQTVTLTAGTSATTLDLDRSEDVRVAIDGSVDAPTESWRVEALTVDGPVLDCRDCWGATVGGRTYDEGTYNATSTAGEGGIAAENLSLRYANDTDDSALAGYWRLDRAIAGTGGTVPEYSGSGLTGEARGGVTTGASGVFDTSGYALDGGIGTDDVTFGDRDELDTSDSFTASLWVNSSLADEERRWILAKGGSMTLRQSWNDEWEVGIENSQVRATGPPVTTDTWVHLTVRYDDRTEEATLWVNGKREADATFEIGETSEPLTLGNNTDATQERQFEGLVDELRFYDTALEADRIEELSRYRPQGEARGSYEQTIRTADRQQPTALRTNVTSLPEGATLDATVETLATTGEAQDEQTVTIDSSGTSTVPLSVDPGTDLRVSIEGSTADPAATWAVQNLTVDRERVPDPATRNATTSSIAAPDDWDAGTYNGTSIDGSTGRSAGTLSMRYANGSTGDDLVGFWRSDSAVAGTDGTVPDYSGEGHTGTTEGGLTTDGVGVFDSGAYDYDGSDDAVNLGQPDQLDQTDSFTVGAWVNLDEEDGTYHPIVQKGNSQWGLRANDSSNAWYFYAYDGSSHTGAGGEIDAVAGEWTHVAGRYNASADELSLWVDGVEAETDSISSIAANSYNVTIGADEEHPDRHFDGRIDEVQMYDRALSDDAMATFGRTHSDGEADGSYEKTITTDETQHWSDLTVNTTAMPTASSLTVDVASIEDGTVQGTDTVTIDSTGETTTTVDVPDAPEARITIDGASTDPEATWAVTNVSLAHEEPLSSELTADRDWATGTTAEYEEGEFWATSADAATGDRAGGLTMGYANGSAGDDLLGYWRMDRNLTETNGTVTDYSALGHDGVATNVSTDERGLFGTSSANYSASGAKVSVPANESLAPEEDFAVAAWINTSSLGTSSGPSNQTAIVKKAEFSENTGFSLLDDGDYDSTLYMRVHNGNDYSEVGIDRSTVNDGTWHHLVGVYDDDAGEIRVYLDGQRQATAQANGFANASSRDLGIGANSTGGNRLQSGRLDEVRLYNRSLSDGEVARLYPGGSPPAGNYSRSLTRFQNNTWTELRANLTSLPDGATVNATVRALDGDTTVGTQTVTLSNDSPTHDLSVPESPALRLELNGTIASLEDSWRVENVTVASTTGVDATDQEIVALDPATGSYRWGQDLETTVSGSPALANGTVYPGLANGSVAARDSETGTVDWRHEWPRSPMRAPAVTDDTLVVDTEEGRLRAAWTANGTERWAIRPGSRGTAPAVLNETVFVGGTNDTRAVD
ncbi:MAG: LamG-like jellyroll fold domain-containing protein [Halococcoides sp.]